MEDKMEDESQLDKDVKLTENHLTMALSRVKCSINEKDKLYYDKLKAKIKL